MMPYKLIVAGGRNFSDRVVMHMAIYRIINTSLAGKDVTFVTGMARGADMLGRAIALDNGFPVVEMPADWDKHGRSAGYVRNAEMADVADGLLAFWDGSSRGTKGMIDVARKKGLEVWVEHYADARVQGL